MFYYIARRFLTWTAAAVIFLAAVLTASVYLRAFVGYQALPPRLALAVAALQIPDALRFACCFGAFCLAARAVGRREIALVRTTGGGPKVFLQPILMVAVTMSAFCVFYDSLVVPSVQAGLLKREDAALVRGMRSSLAHTGLCRLGKAVFSAGGVDGETVHDPRCYVGDLVVRGDTLVTEKGQAVIRNAEIRDVHGKETLEAGSFHIRLPSKPAPLTGRERWTRRPWRAYGGMCAAISIVPLAMIGLVGGFLVGRLGQVKAFLALLVMTFVVYLGVENALLEFGSANLDPGSGWATYLWGIAVACVARPCAARAIRSRWALGIGA